MDLFPTLGPNIVAKFKLGGWDPPSPSHILFAQPRRWVSVRATCDRATSVSSPSPLGWVPHPQGIKWAVVLHRGRHREVQGPLGGEGGSRNENGFLPWHFAPAVLSFHVLSLPFGGNNARKHNFRHLGRPSKNFSDTLFHCFAPGGVDPQKGGGGTTHFSCPPLFPAPAGSPPCQGCSAAWREPRPPPATSPAGPSPGRASGPGNRPTLRAGPSRLQSTAPRRGRRSICFCARGIQHARILF